MEARSVAQIAVDFDRTGKVVLFDSRYLRFEPETEPRSPIACRWTT